MTDLPLRRRWRLPLFVFVMLTVEFLDEFAFSALETARPFIRDSFDLNYVEIGLLISLPAFIANFVEPVIGLFADTHRRRLLMIVGGVLFGAGFIVQGLAPTYAIFLLTSIVVFPSNGSFVNIAQAALMDYDPKRRENGMALWTFSGSLAVLTGPLALTLLVATGGSWRHFFIAAGLLTVLVALAITRLPATKALRTTEDAETRSIGENIRGAWHILRRLAVWRWMILLEFSNLMLDVMFSLLALYMVDVAGVSQTQAGLAIAVWTGVGLVGDFLLIPILERTPGLAYLRVSVIMELILFPMFLLVDTWTIKLILLGIIGLFNAGWYAILQSKLYDELDEQSGAILIVGNIGGFFGALIPITLGVVAESFGLDIAMWLLLAGPLALLIGLPRHTATQADS